MINNEIIETIRRNDRAIVALESTIITHGMPYPYNLQTAIKIESIIREIGAQPATIGIIDGIVYVGLNHEQLKWLAERGYDGPFGPLSNDCSSSSNSNSNNHNNNNRIHCNQTLYKISRGDLAMACQKRNSGGTTVSATSFLANLAGIKVFVTGGIGGVHRGGEISMDISNDLHQLSQTPILVVSAGVKSILDIGKTLEVLETYGVCVSVFDDRHRQNNIDNINGRFEFPAFYTPNSGYYVNYNYTSYKSVAELIEIRDELRIPSAILLAVPYRSTETNDFQREFETALKCALNEANQKNIKGKSVTPFLLSRMSQLTNNSSLRLNQKLIENNATVGARIAVEYSKLMKSSKIFNPNDHENNQKINYSSSSSIDSSNSNNENNSNHHESPVVIGGSVYDVIVKINSPNIQLNGSTFAGQIRTTLGGVGRNVAESIKHLYGKCFLISAVGHDYRGQLIVDNITDKNSHKSANEGIRILSNKHHDSSTTSSSTVIIDNNGECRLVIGDFAVNQSIDIEFVSKFENQLKQAPIIIMDANISTDTMNYLCDLCRQSRIPIWYEPTDLNLTEKLFQILSDRQCSIKFLSPNFNELKAFHDILTNGHLRNDDRIIREKFSSSELVEIVEEYGRKLFQYFRGLHSLIVTVDKDGIVYVGPNNSLDQKISLGPNSPLFNNNQTDSIQATHMAQKPVDNVVNVSGAGDCLAGATITGWLNGWNCRQSLELGLKAAGISIQTFETVPKELNEILVK